jgi:hypothetical protein
LSSSQPINAETFFWFLLGRISAGQIKEALLTRTHPWATRPKATPFYEILTPVHQFSRKIFILGSWELLASEGDLAVAAVPVKFLMVDTLKDECPGKESNQILELKNQKENKGREEKIKVEDSSSSIIFTPDASPIDRQDNFVTIFSKQRGRFRQ